jgi:hypothetical protein
MPVDGGPPFSGPTVNGTVTVTPGMTVGQIGAGFLGFSFEKTHLTDQFFTGQNATLVALFNLLGPGSLRIGANDVDRCTWVPNAMPVSGAPFPTTIGTVEVDALADFVNATGWKVVYGVNLKTGTPANSAQEAAYVSMKLGSSLVGFEIGNEIDRNNGWTYTQAKTAWESFETAIRGMTPNAPFAGPATDPGAYNSFAVIFAHDEASKLSLLTHHYYRASATSNPTMAELLNPDPNLVTILKALSTAATSNNLADGYRLGECNSFSSHGSNGISNALASALWSLDFFFVNAQNGSGGINFHGGQTGMDGTTPFLYSPIAEGPGGITGVNPLFYGMLTLAQAGTGNVLATKASAGSLNFTGYALGRSDGSTSVILVNKDAMSGVQASVDMGAPVTSASGIYLQGPSLSATSGVTLAGAGVSATGGWTPSAPYAMSSMGNVVSVLVPPASAALVRVK